MNKHKCASIFEEDVIFLSFQ